MTRAGLAPGAAGPPCAERPLDAAREKSGARGEACGEEGGAHGLYEGTEQPSPPTARSSPCCALVGLRPPRPDIPGGAAAVQAGPAHLGDARWVFCRFQRKLLEGCPMWGRSAGQEDCSPRLRGWTQAPPDPGRRPVLLPEPAGMDPGRCRRTAPSRTAPRACGDGPREVRTGTCASSCSPRLRGWTRGKGRRRGRGHLLPAPAGMDPGPARRRSTPGPAPPRPRGWTRTRLPRP